MKADLVVKNGWVVTPQDTVQGGVAISDGKFVAIGTSDTLPDGNQVIDAVAPTRAGAEEPPHLRGVLAPRDPHLDRHAGLSTRTVRHDVHVAVRDHVQGAVVAPERGRAKRQRFDPVGHYNRPDVLQLTVRGDDATPSRRPSARSARS